MFGGTNSDQNPANLQTPDWQKVFAAIPPTGPENVKKIYAYVAENFDADKSAKMIQELSAALNEAKADDVNKEDAKKLSSAKEELEKIEREKNQKRQELKKTTR